MKRAVLLLFLAACDKPAPSPAPAGPTTLAWKFEINKTYWVRNRTNFEHATIVEGDVAAQIAVPKFTYEKESVTEILVLNEGPAGEFGLRLTPLDLSLKGSVGAVDLSLQMKDGQWVKEEIGSQTPPPGVNLKDKIEEIKTSAKTTSRRFGTSATRDSAKPTSAPGALSWPSLPPGPVTVGATWTEPLGVGPVLTSLKGGVLSAANKVVKIDGDIVVITSSLYDVSEAKGEALRVKRERSAKFDLKRGLFVEMQDFGEMVHEGAVPAATEGGKPGRYKRWLKISSDLNLLDRR